MQRRIQVIIADHHPIVRQGLRTILERDPQFIVLTEVSSGRDAIFAAQTSHPDVLLLDISMHDISGIVTISHIKHSSPETQVVVLTASLNHSHVANALRAGATSYILKDIPCEELISAVHKAAHGESTLHPQVATPVVQAIQQSSLHIPEPFSLLSVRERSVLCYIAQGYSNAAIALELVISEKTVKSHVSSILNKLGLADRTQAAAFAWQQGIMGSASSSLFLVHPLPLTREQLA
jgi:NarL family two-component system response regulator LiaR